jgi:hypothetical protein
MLPSHGSLTRLEFIYDAYSPTTLEHTFTILASSDSPALAEVVIRFCGAQGIGDFRASQSTGEPHGQDALLSKFPAPLLQAGRLRMVELAFEGVRCIMDPDALLAAFVDVTAAGLLHVTPESATLLGPSFR